MKVKKILKIEKSALKSGPIIAYRQTSYIY